MENTTMEEISGNFPIIGNITDTLGSTVDLNGNMHAMSASIITHENYDIFAIFRFLAG